MKIENTINGLVTKKSGNGSNVAARPASSGEKAADVAGAKVDLSAAAALQHSEGSGAAFDVQRIAEIRQAIAEGRFQVNPERIADNLLASVREMLAQPRNPA